MEEEILYLLYLSIILTLGVLITSVTTRLRLSNILFLVLLGNFLEFLGFNFFGSSITIILSQLALIMIILESAAELDMKHIIQNFFHVFKFSIFYFLISGYIMTFLIYLFVDLPSKGFETLVLCMLLSIIIYGVDPSIVNEFLKSSKSKVREILEIEGMISTPFVVVFAFFLIGYLSNADTNFSLDFASQFLVVFKQIGISAVVGVVLAFLMYRFLILFTLAAEFSSIMILSVAIAVYSLGEMFGLDGSIAVAFYGLFLSGQKTVKMPQNYSAVLAHLLYILVFVLFGTEMVFGSWHLILVGFELFIAYLILRYLCIYLFVKDLNKKEMLFMALNTSKGIETAIVLFIMKVSFDSIPGIDTILSLGFVFFILSFLVATIANYFSDALLIKT